MTTTTTTIGDARARAGAATARKKRGASTRNTSDGTKALPSTNALFPGEVRIVMRKKTPMKMTRLRIVPVAGAGALAVQQGIAPGLVEKVFRKNGRLYVQTIEGNSSDSVRRNTWTVGDSVIAGFGTIR